MAVARVVALAFALAVTGCADRRAAPPPAATARANTSARVSSGSASADAPIEKVGWFLPAASLDSPRALHTATVLTDGRVLVTGGSDGDAILQDAELYDPVTDTWIATTGLTEQADAGLMLNGAVPTARQAHTATLLAGTSEVLLAGGLGVERLVNGQPTVEALHTCFLFDPVANRFVRTSPLAVARFWQLATPLHDGRVLVVGGFDDRGATSVVAELFDPVTRTWSRVSQRSDAHAWGAIATTPGSTVGETIVHGGASIDVRRALVLATPAARTERFDAASSAFTLGAPGVVHDHDAIIQMASAVIDDGRVLFAGGRAVTAGQKLVVSGALELYDPTTRSYVAGPTLAAPRYSAELAAIGASGDQLVVGGIGADGVPVAACEVWDAGTNTLLGSVSLQVGRSQHRAVRLHDGRILVIGGTTANARPTDACEVHEREADPAAVTPATAPPVMTPSGP